MNLSLGLSHRQICRCSYCNWDITNHDPECPTARIEALEQHAFYVLCPKCDSYSLALNDGDFWQCYSCNVVMTCLAPLDEDDEAYFIDHWRFDDAQVVRVISNPDLRPRKYERLFKEIEELEAMKTRLIEERE